MQRDDRPPEGRDHVMEGRDGPVLRREDRGIEGVGMNDGPDIGSVQEDVAMQPPFARRRLGPGPRAVVIGGYRHFRDILGCYFRRQESGWRDQHAVRDACGNVTRRALVEATPRKLKACGHEGVAKIGFHMLLVSPNHAPR